MAGDPWPYNSLPPYLNGNPTPSIWVSPSAVKEALTETFEKSATELAQFKELRQAIDNFLDNHELYISSSDRANGIVWFVGCMGQEVFTSVSYVACVEYALNQITKGQL